ncbi:MAG: SRPBCC family protein [Actinomycetota bacterium]|nr:SRPBCC family protein [Actinomycetota bacterium]
MADVSKHINASPEQVWSVLADGWMFSGWVVGASHIRDVDANWPQVDTRLHHQAGAWPLLVSDSTAVIESVRPTLLVLQARAWPVGEARVSLTLSGDGEGCEVRMREWPTHGVARYLHSPVQDAILAKRNLESLDRLASIAEHRPAPAGAYR